MSHDIVDIGGEEQGPCPLRRGGKVSYQVQGHLTEPEFQTG